MYNRPIYNTNKQKTKQPQPKTLRCLMTVSAIRKTYNVISESPTMIFALNEDKTVIFQAEKQGLFCLVSNPDLAHATPKKKPKIKRKIKPPKQYTLEEISNDFLIFEKSAEKIIALDNENLAVFIPTTKDLYFRKL